MADERVGKARYETEVDNTGLRQGMGEADDVISKAGASAEDAFGNKATAGISKWDQVTTGALQRVGHQLTDMAIGWARALPTAVLDKWNQAVDLASDKAESTTKAQVLFGGSFGVVEEASRNAATTVGLSSGAYLTAAGNLGNLITNFGIAKPAAADMANEMVQLASDLGSFNNANTEEVTLAMGAAFRGETEPIRRFGVMLDVASVTAKAVELGLIGVGEALTPAARLQATYALILEQTTSAQGDFARTSEGYANTQKINAAIQEEAWTRLGEKLMPVSHIFNTVLAGAISTVVDLLGGLWEVVAHPAGLAAIGVIGVGVGTVVVPAFIAWAAAAWATVAPMLLLAAPVVAVAAAVAALVFVLEELGILDDIIGTLQDLGAQVMPMLQGAFEAVMGVVGELGYRLGGLIGVITDVLGAIIDFADAIVRALAGDFEGAAEAAARGMDRIGSAGTNMARVMGDATQRAIDDAARLEAETAAAAERVRTEWESTRDRSGLALSRLATEYGQTADAATTSGQEQEEAARGVGRVVPQAVEQVRRALGDLTGALGGLGTSSDSAWQKFKSSTRDGTEDPEARIEKLQKRLNRLNTEDLSKLGPAALANWAEAKAATEQELGGLTSFVSNRSEIIESLLPNALETSRRESAGEWQGIFTDARSYLSDTADTAQRLANSTHTGWMDPIRTTGRQSNATWQDIWRTGRGYMADLANDADIYGERTGRLYGSALGGMASYVKGKARVLVQGAREILRAESPPGPESPLHEIGEWAERTAVYYGDRFGAMRGYVQDRVRSVLEVGDRAAAMLAPLSQPMLASAVGNLTLHHRVELDLRNAPPGITEAGVGAIVERTMSPEAMLSRTLAGAYANHGVRWRAGF